MRWTLDSEVTVMRLLTGAGVQKVLGHISGWAPQRRRTKLVNPQLSRSPSFVIARLRTRWKPPLLLTPGNPGHLWQMVWSYPVIQLIHSMTPQPLHSCSCKETIMLLAYCRPFLV